MRAFYLAALAIAGSVAALTSASAQYAPWPPPPGMTAGEYSARYGHRIEPYERNGDRGWERDRRRQWQREQRRRRDYDYDDD